MKTYPALLLCLIFLSGPIMRADYSPPNDTQLDRALANPNLVGNLLQGANGAEAAQLLSRLLRRVQERGLGNAQQQYLAAFYAGRIAFLLGGEAGAFLDALAAQVPNKLSSAVFSGLAVALRGSSELMAALRESAGENEALLTAVNNPRLSLTDPVYTQLVASLGSVQSLPPVAPDSITVTLDPQGQPFSGALAPPIPPVYPGQS
jgi:hypothetical protein